MTSIPFSPPPTPLATRSPGSVVAISVSTGGSGYTAPPTVGFSGGGGTGAAAVAHMAGTMVESIVLTDGGSGYTSNPAVTISGNAQATAYAYAGPRRPVSFFRSRFNDMYAVDGMGRGLRWNGDDGNMQPIGLTKPHRGPTVSVSNATPASYVSAVEVMKPGAGYTTAPAVTFSGGSPATPAKAVASVSAGRVSSIVVTDSGSGYKSTPNVTLSGGQAGGATFNVGVAGSVYSVAVESMGSGYTGTPTVQFSTSQGLTRAAGYVSVSGGSVIGVDVLSGGTAATTSGVTATIVGGGGTGATIRPVMSYRVSAVTVSSAGTGFFTPPVVSILPDPADTQYRQAYAESTVNSSGGVSSVRVLDGGQYHLPPSAKVLDGAASATATMAPQMSGVYKCCIRYLDNTPASQQGPVPSSISELTEVDAAAAGSALTWTFSHAGLDARVTAMELWRTTSAQSVVLFRVATIQRSEAAFFGSYTDTLSDDDLKDTERPGYGLMPVTLPSGQVNARRFEVPPGNYAVAVMFQDRAWYAVDTTGASPNSLIFSEVDEPESAPLTNEIVVQESAGDSDAVVALIPLAYTLLIAQSRHVYKMQYVAQPVIDASILLGVYRGILNAQCWAVLGGVAFIVDSFGMYAYDGNQADPVSAPIDDFWRNRVIDFSQASVFHLQADPATKTVRFFYCRAGETATVRALCYCLATKAWWEEEYPKAITSGANMEIGGRQDVIYGDGDGGFSRTYGYADGSSAVAFRMRTGCLPLANADKGSRAITVLYTPTQDDNNLTVALHYNGSSTPRPNAISSNRGDGFVSSAGSTGAVLNLKSRRSALGDASGCARAYYAGSVDDRSAGGDRHVALSLTGQQSSASNAVILHGVTLEGASG